LLRKRKKEEKQVHHIGTNFGEVVHAGSAVDLKLFFNDSDGK